MIGGVLSGVWYCLLRGIPVWKLADIAGPAIMLGLAFGRVGCFFGGCCHGRPLEEFITHFRAELGADRSDAIIQESLGRVRTADDFFMALAQAPKSATAFADTVETNTELQQNLAEVGQAVQVDLSELGTGDELTTAKMFRDLSEGISDIKQSDFPASDVQALSTAFGQSLTDDAWQFLWSQGDMLRKVSNEDKDAGADQLNPSALATFKGGKVLTVDGGPGLALNFQEAGVGYSSCSTIRPRSNLCFSLFALAFIKRLRRFDGHPATT